MEKEKIILDVDTGSDDAIALILAMLSDEYDLMGICSVNGNVEVKLTTDNSLRVVEYFGWQDQVKVYPGADLPMVATLNPWTPQSTGIRTEVYRDQVNPRREKPLVPDENGKIIEYYDEVSQPDHLPLPKPTIQPAPISAVEYYLQTLRAAEDHSITLVPVGPLTNVALAMRSDPSICKKIKKIVIMGGGHLCNNSTPASEFNIWVDPESAEVVLQSGCEILFVPLDATHEAYITVDQAKEIKKIGSKEAAFICDILIQRYEGYSNFDAEMKERGGAPLHDALALCAVTHPEVLKTILDANVHVDTGNSYAYGQTIVDRRIRVNPEPVNAKFALGSHRDLFYSWMIDILQKATNK